MTYKKISNGTIVKMLPDGGSHPVEARTDWERVSRWTEAEIEAMAGSDPEHPALDDQFWADAERQEQPVVTLEPDVAAQFGSGDPDVQRHVNAILRDHFRSKRAAS